MSPVRRGTAPPPAPVVAEADMFNFGNLSGYVGGKTIPEGDYALEYTVMNRPPSTTGKSFPDVGVMLTAHPLNGGDPYEQYLSFGGKAHLSWTPDADTGKRIIKIPQGPGLPPSNKSNWFLHLESLSQCNGGPLDFLSNDLSVLDGTWAHITPTPEPEERKNYKKAPATGETGAVEDEGPRTPGLIPYVTEILEGGKPWEGGGGFVTQAPAAKPAAAAPKAVAPRAAAPARQARPTAVAPPPPPAPEPAGDDEDLGTVASNALADVLIANPNGIKRLKLRLATHAAVLAKYDDQTASDVVKTYFDDDAAFQVFIGDAGYKVKGVGPQADVIPA